jgi:hypothetical protein
MGSNRRCTRRFRGSVLHLESDSSVDFVHSDVVVFQSHTSPVARSQDLHRLDVL